MKNKDLELLSEIMDSKFNGPFEFRFGLDGLIGLIPVAGDIITSAVSLYIVVRAAYLKYPISLILWMCLNIVIDTLVGLVPFVGDIFDFIWKSNEKNLNLMKPYDKEPIRIHRSSAFLICFILLVTFSILLGSIAGSVLLIQKLF